MLNKLNIRRVKPTEAKALLHITKTTFLDAFAHQNTEGDIRIYSEAFFNPDRITSELNNPDSAFYFIEDESNITGYIKLNYADAQTEFNDAQAVEIERIYVLAEYQGKQIGQQLLNFAIDTARGQALEYIWLGVWEKNSSAIRFYQRYGFTPIGSHPFTLGNDRQTDILMRKEL